MSTLSTEQRSLLESATARFEAELAVDTAAQTYLVGRGLTAAVARGHRIGSVPAGYPMFEDYAGRLAIPYLTPAGVVDIRFRAMHGEEPKYLSRGGERVHIYNVLAFQDDSDFIAIAEGEIDTMSAHTLCGIPCVGMAGVNAWKSWMSRAFGDYSTVFILCDGDDPGHEMGKKIRRDLDNGVVIHMPTGKDVNDMVLAEGPDWIRTKVGL